ncbi:hypothetical protein C8F04DRAFT_1282093 [Mycena alexandri]|uniref:Uncharacterized protein n=1 Tax=Mycena alexandri TaxID=1745969 RepID=A0AAD6RW68_9AGAR|nr:hypothetical protein C8F04DRAFT_1282093 [Mycena alexandri]
MQQNSPKKTIAEWKQSRHSAPQNQHPTQPTEPPHPSAIDLLRNRNPTTPLGPFDGRVGAIAEVNGEKYYITTNTDYIPAVPSLQHPHAVYLRSDMCYGTDDPTLWPQQWTDRYCHMPLIAKKGTRADLAPMWWDPSPRDWIVGSAVTRALGRLPVGRISWLVEVVHKVVQRCTDLRRSNENLHPLFAELIQHILMWVEQLQSLPTTFPKMLFALTSLQREVLELDALYEYISIYKTRIAHYVPGTAHSVAKTIGAFMSSPGVAQQLWSAGIPFWFLRPTYVFDAENILEVVPLLEPSFSLPDPDAHAVGAPPALYTGNSTLDKIDAIHRAVLHTPWYHDPFETGVGRASSPSPPPIASTSAQSDARPPPSISNRAPPRPQSSASRYRPYAPKANAPKGTPKVARDKFAPITAPEMPPSIICMENALAKVDRTSRPYTAADTRYVLPEPALFLNNNLARRYKWLHHWKLLRNAVWFMLVDNPQLLALQQWRDVLEGVINTRGERGSKTYRRSREVEEIVLPVLRASGTENLGALPVADELVPEFTLEETREIIWEVAEAGFRFELCALDRKASGKQRLAQVKDCFAGHMLIGTPLRFAKLGWAAPTLEERHRYVARTAQLMVDWRTRSSPPRILQRVVDRRPWSVSGMQELETAVCEYYTQAFWEHFGRAAVLPVRLEHDLAEEQEDNMDKEPGEL